MAKFCLNFILFSLYVGSTSATIQSDFTDKTPPGRVKRDHTDYSGWDYSGDWSSGADYQDYPPDEEVSDVVEGTIIKISACTDVYDQAAPLSLTCRTPAGQREGSIYIHRAYYGWSQSATRCGHSDGDTCVMNGLHEDEVAHCMGEDACEIETWPAYIERCAEVSTYLTVEYICIPDTEELRFCSDITASGTTGYLRSPLYPDFHPELRHCECEIKANRRLNIEIEVLAFELEASTQDGNCLYDYMEIIKDNQDAGDRYCDVLPRGSEIFVTTDNLRMIFNSDDSVTHRGFWVKYSATRRNSGNPAVVELTCRRSEPVTPVPSQPVSPTPAPPLFTNSPPSTALSTTTTRSSTTTRSTTSSTSSSTTRSTTSSPTRSTSSSTTSSTTSRTTSSTTTRTTSTSPSSNPPTPSSINTPSSIAPSSIAPSSTTLSTSSPTTNAGSSGSSGPSEGQTGDEGGLSQTTIIAIAVCISVIVIILGGLFIIIRCRKSKSKPEAPAAPPSKLATLHPLPLTPSAPDGDYTELSIDPKTGAKYRVSSSEQRRTYTALTTEGLVRNTRSIKEENVYEQIDHPPPYTNPGYDQMIVPPPDLQSVLDRKPKYVNQTSYVNVEDGLGVTSPGKTSKDKNKSGPKSTVRSLHDNYMKPVG